MLPISKLSVVNQALLELGKPVVVSINDSDDSQLIAAKLDLLFPLLLEVTFWNFAIIYKLDNTPLTSNPTTYSQYTYQLPANYGRMYLFSPATTGQGYFISGGQLQTNLKPVDYFYITNDVDYDAISTLFFRALSIYAAADSCLVITENEDLTQYLQAKYEMAKSDAILQNDMELYKVTVAYNEFNRITYV